MYNSPLIYLLYISVILNLLPYEVIILPFYIFL